LPRDGRRALRSVRATGGAFLTATDEEILAAVQQLGQKAGIYADPASAAAYAGLAKAVQKGQIRNADRVVLIITARGRTQANLFK
jgi:threonine synthase